MDNLNYCFRKKAFQIYCLDNIFNIKKEYPVLNDEDIHNKLIERWKVLPDTEKSKYITYEKI